MEYTNLAVKESLGLDIESIRNDFPILTKKLGDKQMVYLDNAATTHKPRQVIEAMSNFDSGDYGTVRRGAYRLGEMATEKYESVRKKVAALINAANHKEIIFTSGTTQSINLAAYSFGRGFVNEGDELIISNMEHHANIIPWQVMCEDRGATLKVIPVNDTGDLIMEEYEKLLTNKTKIVSVTHVSNALGTINPVKEITEKAQAVGAKVLIDGAQSTPHMQIDVQEIGCDFYVFSGHKMYGPSGVGVLYGKYDLLAEMPPYITGGEMINLVTMERTTFAKPPARFEGGTPPITQVIGLGAAIDYLQKIGLDKIDKYEQQLLAYGTDVLSENSGIRIIGTSNHKAGILSFTLEHAHPHDVLTILDSESVCVRGGHHCAQPIMKFFCVPATTRASFSFYNNFEEIDKLAEAIKKVQEIFK